MSSIHGRKLCACLGSSLASLLLQTLAGNADALLLIGIGWAERTHICSNLTDLSLIRSADDDVGLLVDGDLNALRNVEGNRVRLAESERNGLAFQFGTVTDANDVELFLETRGYACDSIGQERTSQTMKRTMIFVVANGCEYAVFLLQLNLRRH